MFLRFLTAMFIIATLLAASALAQGRPPLSIEANPIEVQVGYTVRLSASHYVPRQLAWSKTGGNWCTDGRCDYRSYGEVAPELLHTYNSASGYWVSEEVGEFQIDVRDRQGNREMVTITVVPRESE